MLVLVGALCCGQGIAGAQVNEAQPSLEVVLRPEQVGIGETMQLVVTLWGAEPAQHPGLVGLENLEVVAGPMTSRNFSWVNGKASTSYQFTYYLRGRAVGPATVGAVVVSLGQQELRSEPLGAKILGQAQRRNLPSQSRLINVTQGARDRRTRDGPDGQLMLRLYVENREPYLGEPVLVSLVLDSNVARVASFELDTPPSFPGWWVHRIDEAEPAAPGVAEVDGVRFVRHMLARYVVIALRSGELVLPGVRATVVAQGHSPFAPSRRVVLTTQAVAVRVKERPYAPEGFYEAVGSLSYHATLTPEVIAYGESAVLSIELSGSGNLPLVQAPELWPMCESCEVFPPEEESHITLDEHGISGSRVWRITVVPGTWGDIRLSPTNLAFFDPQVGTYRRQSVGALTLTVAPPQATAPSAGAEETASNSAPHSNQSLDVHEARAGWVVIMVLLTAGAGVGGLVTWLFTRGVQRMMPRFRPGQSPAEMARLLQASLEQWWTSLSDPPAALAEQKQELQKQLEAVRFAPGRADHTETITFLVGRARRLMKRKR